MPMLPVNFRLGLVVVLLILGLSGPGRLVGQTEERSKADQRPNIIYIMLDDAGYADFGRSGSEQIKTPSFDQLCREGVFFDQHYSGSAVCAPTRCVLMTGLHSGHCKRRDNKATGNLKETSNGLVFLDQTDLTIAKHLQQAGYATGGIGKWGLGNSGTDGSPDKQGFDHFLGYLDQVHAHNHYTDWLWNDGQRMELTGNKNNGRSTYVHDILEEDTLSFIRQHANKPKPFFLYLPYTLPHGKYDIPANDPSLAVYKNQPWPQPVKNYAAMITRADQTVGKMMSLLKELNIDENTIVFYTSDNGPNSIHAKTLGSGGPFRGIKRQLHEGGIRAAMGVRWPGKIQPNQTSHFIWSMIDVFPTVCELAQVAAPQSLDGVSIVPTLMGKKQEPLEFVYFEIHHPFQQAVRMNEWKAYRKGTEEPLLLYNVLKDPQEASDVASEQPKIVDRIEKIMAKEHVESAFYPARKKAKVQRKRKKANSKAE